MGLVVFQFANDIDIGYLDFERPRQQDVLCLDEWPLRQKTWGGMEFWVDWSTTNMDTAKFFREHQCGNGSLSLMPVRCAKTSLPLRATQNPLGVPLGERFEQFNDYVEMGAHFFLYISIWLWVFVTSHDMALLSVTKRDYVMDVRGICKLFACTRKLLNLSGLPRMRRMLRRKGCDAQHRCQKFGHIIALLLFPIFLVWFLIWFVCIVIPVGTLVFLAHPIRLSRAMVFLTCILLALLGLVVAIVSLVAIGDPDVRQSYAVTWAIDGCDCGCVYPISGGKFFASFLIGAGVIYKTLLLAFKCLKGLRRSNWASLMSVMFPVPLNAYSVCWTRPNGEPIQHRGQDEPVQGEIAFDPFALMDEQPESASTSVNLVPTLISRSAGRERASARDIHDDPDPTSTANDKPRVSDRVEEADVAAARWKAAKADDVDADITEVGCCGFPCARGGAKKSMAPEDISQEQRDIEAARLREQARGLRDQAERATSLAEKLEDRADYFARSDEVPNSARIEQGKASAETEV